MARYVGTAVGIVCSWRVVVRLLCGSVVYLVMCMSYSVIHLGLSKFTHSFRNFEHATVEVNNVVI